MKTNILKSIIVSSSITVALSLPTLGNEEFVVYGVEQEQLNSIDISNYNNIEEYRFNLQTALENKGYFLSRVEYHYNNIYVDLGSISNIEIVGIENSNKDLIRRYITTLQEKDLTLKKVDRVLTLVNSIPGVSATFSFQRDEEGKYTIVVSGDEIKQNGSIIVDNIPTRLGKRSRVSLSQNLYSLITSGDVLRFEGSHVRGDSLASQTGYSISYQDQLEFNGGYWEITYGDNKSKTNLYSPLTGTTQNSYDGNYSTISIAHPLVVKHNHESFLIAQYEHSKEDTNNLGNVKLNLFRASYFDLYHGNYGDSISLGVTFSYGKNQEHYNSNEEKSFKHLRVGGGYITPIGLNNKTEFRAESYAQIGSKDVVGSELFFLGSENFLRGYKPGYFVAESGFAGTFELAHSYDNSIKFVQRLTPYIFTDYGMVFNDNQNINGTSRKDKQEAYSIGLGAKVYMKNNLFLETYLAKPLTDDYDNRSINPSVYVQLQYSW